MCGWLTLPSPDLTRCNTKKGTGEFVLWKSKFPLPSDLTRCNTKKGTEEFAGSASGFFDGHHPDPEAVLHDLVPANNEDDSCDSCVHDARYVLVVGILGPLEQDNRPPATSGLGALEDHLRVPQGRGLGFRV